MLKLLTTVTKLLQKITGDANKTVGVYDHFDFSAFHVPTCKLVTKSYARLLYNDYVSNPSKFADLIDETTRKHIDGLTYDESLTDKILEKTFVGLAKDETKKSSTSFASPYQYW